MDLQRLRPGHHRAPTHRGRGGGQRGALPRARDAGARWRLRGEPRRHGHHGQRRDARDDRHPRGGSGIRPLHRSRAPRRPRPDVEAVGGVGRRRRALRDGVPPPRPGRPGHVGERARHRRPGRGRGAGGLLRRCVGHHRAPGGGGRAADAGRDHAEHGRGRGPRAPLRRQDRVGQPPLRRHLRLRRRRARGHGREPDQRPRRGRPGRRDRGDPERGGRVRVLDGRHPQRPQGRHHLLEPCDGVRVRPSRARAGVRVGAGGHHRPQARRRRAPARAADARRVPADRPCGQLAVGSRQQRGELVPRAVPPLRHGARGGGSTALRVHGGRPSRRPGRGGRVDGAVDGHAGRVRVRVPRGDARRLGAHAPGAGRPRARGHAPAGGHDSRHHRRARGGAGGP